MNILHNNLAPTLSLDGLWQFALGHPPSWHTIRVPGCWEAQGYSKTVDGPALYRREFALPNRWPGQRLLVEFDAVSYACTVRVNGQEVGEHRGLWTPFAFDITPAVRPGEENVIELEVYKPGERYPMRSCLAGFLPDVATTFGGLWQSARLRALRVGLDDLRLDADPETGQLRVRCRAIPREDDLNGSHWAVQVSYKGQVVSEGRFEATAAGLLDATLTVPQPVLWHPAQPALYEVRIRLLREEHSLAEVSRRTGFRRLSVIGNQLLFNDRPVCLRGVLSWGWNPDTIAPWFDASTARAEMQRVRSLGFNMIKLCLFVPNQTYFEVADEEGIFLWQEWPLWLPKITPDLRARLPGEYAELMCLTRHHPAVVLYSLGCELSQEVDADLLRQLDETARSATDHVLFCDNSGSGEAYGGLPFDFSDFTDYHTYSDLQHFEPMLDHWRRDWLPPRPWIFGEFCDSDSFRDPDEIVAAHGGRKPWWMTTAVPGYERRAEVQALVQMKERLAEADLGFAPQELVRIAAAQSLLIRKFTLEAVRRRAGMGGYVITGLRDTPIATSGVFDDLDRPKWLPEDFRRFNEDSVLCLDTGRQRRWRDGGDQPDRLDAYNGWAGEKMRWHLLLSHLAAEPLPAGSELAWQLTDAEGHRLAGGEHRLAFAIPPGPPREVATVEVTLPALPMAQELLLAARLTADETTVANRWPVWCYPRPTVWPTDLVLYDPCGTTLSDVGEAVPTARRVDDLDFRPDRSALVVSSTLSPPLLAYVREGGRLLLLQQGDAPLPARRCPFWREAIKLFPEHPLWRMFPQKGYTDLQFFGLATNVALDARRLKTVLPDLVTMRPILRRLDARQFEVTEYLLEMQVGRGRLLACTLRLQGGLGAQPFGLRRHVAGTYLLWAMLHYLAEGTG